MMLAEVRTRIPIRESRQDIRDIHFDLIPGSCSSDLRPMACCMGPISGLDSLCVPHFHSPLRSASLLKRIEVLRPLGLFDGFGVAISELQAVLAQIQKARGCFASVPSPSLKGH